ncbi:MAG: PspA/IM30 family protein [Nostocaceae cyanobacterium]|nr:PspA/IM30 family protein [Nostocaceae cyanobacterium]
MGLMDRILRVFRANLNGLIRGTEDPEKILEQTVMEMQENLVQLRQAVAAAIASQKRTERQGTQAQSTAEEWYRRAQLALQQGNEPLAREALTKRHAYEDTAKSLFQQVEEQKNVVAKLKKDMRTLELKMAEVKSKKDMYIARARSAQASTRLQEMLGSVGNVGSLGAFERMEEKVMELEAKNEAIALSGTDELEKKFASLESGNDIDAEIAQMRSQLAGDRENSKPKQLPQSDS